VELVFHLSRLAGVEQPVLSFFLWWGKKGPFPLTIPPDGGLRTNELVQYGLYAKGRTAPGPHAGENGFPELGLTVTNAKTLADTPHGRGAAADAYPAIVVKNKVIAIRDNIHDSQTLELFREYGRLAKNAGLEHGGDWPQADWPHVQIHSWRSLPPRKGK
jgi:hypothetical protein